MRANPWLPGIVKNYKDLKGKEIKINNENYLVSEGSMWEQWVKDVYEFVNETRVEERLESTPFNLVIDKDLSKKVTPICHIELGDYIGKADSLEYQSSYTILTGYILTNSL